MTRSHRATQMLRLTGLLARAQRRYIDGKLSFPTYDARFRRLLRIASMSPSDLRTWHLDYATLDSYRIRSPL